MSNQVFKAGDICIFMPPGHEHVEGLSGAGSECELIVTAAHGSGAAAWRCKFPGDHNPSSIDGLWIVAEYALRKKRPPEQKADDDFCEWFDKTINRPTEETVRRVFVDGMWGSR